MRAYRRALFNALGFLALSYFVCWLTGHPFSASTGSAAIGMFFGYAAGWRERGWIEDKARQARGALL